MVKPTQAKIAVCYLARAAEGVAAFERFMRSYLVNPAGHAHDLVIIYKGFTSTTELLRAREVFRDVTPRAVTCGDEMFDIGAYAVAAKELDHDHVCFFNTHSEILAPNWLAHLVAAISQEDVGLAGCSASHESLWSSIAISSKAVWLTAVYKEPYNPRLAELFRHVLMPHDPQWMLSKPKSTLAGTWRPHGQFSFHHAQIGWEAYWADLLRPGGAFEFLAGHDPFPNPHIRSNGFIVDRSTFVDIAGDVGNTKNAAYGFESSRTGLSASIASRGLRLVLIDKAGDQYDVADWTKSQTFRLGNQERLLLSDNQTRGFDAMSDGERSTLALISWGYGVVKRHEVNCLGIGFETNQLMNWTDSLPHIVDHDDYGVRSHWMQPSPAPVDRMMFTDRDDLWP